MIGSLSPHARAWLQIHFRVFLWGFTAVLGKSITIGALPLVWWRMLAVGFILALLPRVWRGVGALTTRQRLEFCGIGVVLSLHWVTFYGAIKLANASVGATCMVLSPMFTALIEPWLAQRDSTRRWQSTSSRSTPSCWRWCGSASSAS